MSDKQAVLLIHGIGEQRPMETLRGFVDAVWTKDPAGKNQYAGVHVWSKPDNVSDSFELRRLTTTQNADGVRTDFYEFYWAHLMQGTKVSHVVAWIRTLILRRPGSVPRQLRTAYFVLWIASLATLGLLLNAAAHNSAKSWASAFIGIAVIPVLQWIFTEIVGDAARYLHVAPPNIQSRHAIRQAGIKVLQALHDRGYERIVVAGHSLGSVIGYDILTHAWPAFNEGHQTDQGAVGCLDALEALADDAAANLDAVRRAQHEAWQELNSNGNAWRVTDFVTMGSPLAHAEILLADDAADLRRKQADRELPTCPPARELISHANDKRQRFSYFTSLRAGRVLHHAAMFAVTRWSNLYFPCHAIVGGDVVGGPLAPAFGRWIKDIPVASRQRLGCLQHTLYWSGRGVGDDAPHLRALREAMRMAGGDRAAAGQRKTGHLLRDDPFV